MKQKMIDAGIKLREDIKRAYKTILLIGAYFVTLSLLFYSACPVVMLTGFPCPGCGLSRAGFSVLKGHFATAWQLHPFIYPLILLGIGWGIVRYFLPAKWEKGGNKILIAIGIVLLIGMLVFYVYRMVRFFPNQTPMLYYNGNLFRMITKLW